MWRRPTELVMKKQQQLSKDLKSVKGSLWHRWEPHIHTPDTVLNNQFKSKDLDDYCDLIEQSDPPIRALGVTDYYSLTSYEKLLEAKSQGRLANVELLFPNVELRFKISTTTDKASDFQSAIKRLFEGNCNHLSDR